MSSVHIRNILYNEEKNVPRFVMCIIDCNDCSHDVIMLLLEVDGGGPPQVWVLLPPHSCGGYGALKPPCLS